MVRLVGASLGFLAFALAILAGVWSGNPIAVIVERAILALVLFFLLGASLGWVAQRVIDERVGQRRAEMEARFAAAGPAGAPDGAAAKEAVGGQGKEVSAKPAAAGAG